MISEDNITSVSDISKNTRSFTSNLVASKRFPLLKTVSEAGRLLAVALMAFPGRQCPFEFYKKIMNR